MCIEKIGKPVSFGYTPPAALPNPLPVSMTEPQKKAGYAWVTNASPLALNTNFKNLTIKNMGDLASPTVYDAITISGDIVATLEAAGSHSNTWTDLNGVRSITISVNPGFFAEVTWTEEI